MLASEEYISSITMEPTLQYGCITNINQATRYSQSQQIWHKTDLRPSSCGWTADKINEPLRKNISEPWKYAVGKSTNPEKYLEVGLRLKPLKLPAFRELQCRCKELNRLCGLVVRVPSYRSRGPGFDSRRYQIFWEVVGLERGPLSLVRITEQLLERKVAAPV
jgi:hypothetical protein